MKSERQQALNKIAELRQQIEEQQKIADSHIELPVNEQVKNYNDICKLSNIENDYDDGIQIMGFSEAENTVIRNVIKKIRICKVYNEGWLPKTPQDRRWFGWYRVSSGSGLVFDGSSYFSDGADTGSAARLSFKTDAHCRDYAKKFMDIEEGIIGL